jgi:hypothetical protein
LAHVVAIAAESVAGGLLTAYGRFFGVSTALTVQALGERVEKVLASDARVHISWPASSSRFETYPVPQVLADLTVDKDGNTIEAELTLQDGDATFHTWSMPLGGLFQIAVSLADSALAADELMPKSVASAKPADTSYTDQELNLAL